MEVHLHHAFYSLFENLQPERFFLIFITLHEVNQHFNFLLCTHNTALYHKIQAFGMFECSNFLPQIISNNV